MPSVGRHKLNTLYKLFLRKGCSELQLRPCKQHIARLSCPRTKMLLLPAETLCYLVRPVIRILFHCNFTLALLMASDGKDVPKVIVKCG